MEHGVSANFEIFKVKKKLKKRSIENFNEFGSEWFGEISVEFDNKKGEKVVTLPFKDINGEKFVTYRITKLLGNGICLCDGHAVVDDVLSIMEDDEEHEAKTAKGFKTLIEAFGMRATDKGIESPIGIMYGHEGHEQAVTMAIQEMTLFHVMAIEYAVQIKNGAESEAVLDALLGKNR